MANVLQGTFSTDCKSNCIIIGLTIFWAFGKSLRSSILIIGQLESMPKKVSWGYHKKKSAVTRICIFAQGIAGKERQLNCRLRSYNTSIYSTTGTTGNPPQVILKWGPLYEEGLRRFLERATGSRQCPTKTLQANGGAFGVRWTILS